MYSTYIHHEALQVKAVSPTNDGHGRIFPTTFYITAVL